MIRQALKLKESLNLYALKLQVSKDLYNIKTYKDNYLLKDKWKALAIIKE
jgi:hypothetical protein